MNRHLRLVGWLHVAYGALVLLSLGLVVLWTIGAALLAMEAAGTVSFGLPGPAALLLALGMTLSAAAALVGGVALLRGRPWARTALLVAAVPALLVFPLGTLVGAYTLWVLHRTGEPPRAAGASA